MPRRGAIPSRRQEMLPFMEPRRRLKAPHAGNPTWGGKTSSVGGSLKEGEAPRDHPAGNASEGATSLEDR